MTADIDTLPDEHRLCRNARYRARFLSWRFGRQVQLMECNCDGLGAHWLDKPLVWADTGEPI